jgi:hypothetical protein
MRRPIPAAILAALALTGASAGAGADPGAVDFSFVVVGCNRVDKADAAGDPSTANVAQLMRTYADVARISPAPAFFFSAGDMVLGYTKDTLLLAAELTAWKALYRGSPLAASATELIPIPGNHEMMNAKRVPSAAAERVWVRTLGDLLVRAGNGPRAGGADSLPTDQRMLTYSFDYHGTHFVLLDTDPARRDSRIPTRWVAADLARARAAKAAHIFAIGHKPAYSYPTMPGSGLGKFPEARDAFWSAMADNGAAAMFAAHDHLYWRTRPAGGRSWQIIAGNGGSPLSPNLSREIEPPGDFYGFTLVTVMTDGRVIVRSYGRDVPAAGYNAPAPADSYPTTLRDSLVIAAP